MNLKIIKTDDGSDTLYNKKLDETYHSFTVQLPSLSTYISTPVLAAL